MDLHQLWTIVSTPDNVPIVLLLFVVPFYTWYGLRQAFANDRLIAQLEADPAMAKTHHRKTQPYRPGWAKEVHVWPYLLRIEFLAAIIVTVILMVWSIYGITISPTMISEGITTPAIQGSKYTSISCSPRKYHGALEGFMVRVGFDGSSSGAFSVMDQTIRMTVTMIAARNSMRSR